MQPLLLALFLLVSTLLAVVDAQQTPLSADDVQLDNFYNAQLRLKHQQRLVEEQKLLEELARAFPQFSSSRLLRFLMNKYNRDVQMYAQEGEHDSRYKRFGRIGGTIVMGR